MYLIGVDYGIKNDIALVSVMKKSGDNLKLVESCKLEDFDYRKYVSSTHQLIGEKVDLEKFQVSLKGKGII